MSYNILPPPSPISAGLVLANVSGSAAPPSGTTVTALLDAALSAAIGTVLVRSTTGWTALAAGTPGQALVAGAAGAAPTWAAVGGTPAARVVAASGGVTMLATDGLLVIKKTTPAATAVTLEASPATGATHTIKDGKGDAGSNPITVSAASGTIDGVANFVLSVPYGAITLVFNGVEWSVT